MRLSEAIGLGSVLIKPRANYLLDESGTMGCALGMAGIAIGLSLRGPKISFCGINIGSEERYEPLREAWPWLLQTVSEYPCGCALDSKCEDHEDTITHLFDNHVAVPIEFGNKDWTLDRLIDWVRSVERVEALEEKLMEEVAVTATR